MSKFSITCKEETAKIGDKKQQIYTPSFTHSREYVYDQVDFLSLIKDSDGSIYNGFQQNDEFMLPITKALIVNVAEL